MSFNAPPPPPLFPEFEPEFGPEPTPPKKGKGKIILIAAAAVLVIGVIALGAFWFLNKAAKPDSMSAPKPTVAATETVAASPSAKPTATPSVTPSPSSAPDASSDSNADPKAATSSGAAQWSTAPKTVQAAPPAATVTVTQQAPAVDPVEESRAAERQRISDRFCSRGNIMVIAETAKHYVSICDVDGTSYYRGESKKSGSIMDLPAWPSGSGYAASNGSGSGSTTYYFDRNHLTVGTSSKLALDDQITSFRDLSYGNWE